MYIKHDKKLPPEYVARLAEKAKRLDIAPGAGGSRFAPWRQTVEVLGEELRDLFPGTLCRATVVALYPSQQLVGHTDPAPAGEGKRYHIPIQMNEGCWVFHDGVWSQLELGCLYEMDPTLVHGAVNWGAEVRLHLMVDIA